MPSGLPQAANSRNQMVLWSDALRSRRLDLWHGATTERGPPRSPENMREKRAQVTP